MSAAAGFGDDRRVPWVFALLIGCYSRSFRARFGGELADVVAAMWLASRGGSRLARVRLGFRLVADLTLGAALERGRSLLPPGEPGRGLRRTRPPLPPVLDSALADIRLALRGVRQHRAFALTVVLTLGVGIGGVTAMWSVVYDVLLRPLPYANADRLVRVWNDLGARAQFPTRYFTSSSAQVVAWQDNAKTVESLAALSIATRTLEGTDHATRIPMGIVTANFFDVLGARPALGRVFRPGEDRAGATPVAVLSHELWRTEFGGDSAVIGRSIRVNGQPTEIVGVARPGFRWLDRFEFKGLDDPQVWMTRVMEPANLGHFYQMIARVRPGVALENVATELGTIAESVEPLPSEMKGRSQVTPITVEPLHQALFGTVRSQVVLPLAAVILVLLLACANTANLLLSRLPMRRTELAMRSALGASRARLVRQLFTESLVLASISAALGVIIAYWSTRLIASLGPRDVPRLDEVTVSGVALVSSVITAVVCTIVFGLAPAVRGSRIDLARDLAASRARPQGFRRERGRAVLLAGELAVALVLLVGAMLVTRSFGRLMGLDLGMDAEHTVTARVSLPAATYQEDLGPLPGGGRIVRFRPEWDRFTREIVQRLTRDPRVAAASAANFTPLGGSAGGAVLDIEGANPAALPQGEAAAYKITWVDSYYFQALSIPLVDGRWLNNRGDGEPSYEGVVNQVLAQRYWPGQNPIGKRFYLPRPVRDGDSLRYDKVPTAVVGVVGDTREAGYMIDPTPRVYVPLRLRAQEVAPSWSVRGLQFALVVRARDDVGAVADIIRREVRAMDSRVPVSELRTIQWVVNETTRGPRFYAFLLSLFGVFAIILTMAGVFGVLAFTVSQRTHEIGVRMALGAQPGAVVRLVVSQVVVAAVLGLVGGLAVAAATTRFVRGLLFELEPTDPASLALAIALLLTAACVAAWIPVRRAVSVDPALALRAE